MHDAAACDKQQQIVVLCGDSWVDRSSYLATLDLLAHALPLAAVKPVDVSVSVSVSLRDALRDAALLVVCGGRPAALWKCLGKSRRVMIQQWLKNDEKEKERETDRERFRNIGERDTDRDSDRDREVNLERDREGEREAENQRKSQRDRPRRHRFLGICAGVAFAKLIAGGCGGAVNFVNLVNDEAWRGCGLSGEVKLHNGNSSPGNESDCNDDYSEDSVHKSLEYHYENGPLMSWSCPDASRWPLFQQTFAGDIVVQRMAEIERIIFDVKTQWICHACTFLNSTSVGKCNFCSESKNYRLPPVGQMLGSIAIILPSSQFLLSSVHPELSNIEAKQKFVDLLVLFMS